MAMDLISNHEFLLSQNKSDEKAVEFRKNGNIKYQQRKFIFALIDYNKSIAFANSKKVIALGYSNRSAVYFEFKRYEDCLKNIEWAFENDYPKEKAANLMKRKAKCEKLMHLSVNSEDLWDFFKLSYPPNKKIPWIVDCVTLRSTSDNEKGIFATQDLKAGDIISIEEPIAPIMTADAFYGRCCNCSKTAFMNLIPCNRSATVMFCSNSCKNELYGKTTDLNNIQIKETRILTEFANLAGGMKNLENIMNKTNWDDPKMKKTIFDYDWSDPNDPNYKENLLKCYLSLKTHGFPMMSQYGKSKTVKRIADLVVNNYINFPYLGIDRSLILLYTFVPLFACLTNHSCSRNAFLMVANNKIITYLIRPVKKNEQIFLNNDRVTNAHMLVKNCQMCISASFLNFLHEPCDLYWERDVNGLKSWIKYALKYINNSPVQQEYWDQYPVTYVRVMSWLGDWCSFPF